MKRFVSLVLALCLVLALSACDLPQMLQKKVEESVGELAEGLTNVVFGRLIYTESDTISTDENGVETATRVETRYSYDDKGNEILNEETSIIDGQEPQVVLRESTYDENGNLLKLVSSYKEKITTYEYEYDSEGRMTRMVTSYPDGTQAVSTSEFDAEGHEIHNVYKGADGESAETTYTYDEKGNNIAYENTNTDAEGNTYKHRNEDTFDEKGNVVRSVSYSNDAQQGVTETEYDDEGRVIRETYTGADGERFENAYTYDANGNEIERKHVDRDGKESFLRKEYDANGNQTRAEDTGGSARTLDVSRFDENGRQIYNRYDSWYENEHSYSVTVYTYDAAGQMQTYMTMDSTGTSETVDYTYDENGYQIKTVHTCVNSDGTGFTTTERNDYDFGKPLG